MGKAEFSNDAAVALHVRVGEDLRTAVAARDLNAVRVLRILLAALDNAQAVPLDDLPNGGQDLTGDVPRRTLTAQQVQAILQGEMASRRAALAMTMRAGRADAAAQLRAELALLAPYWQVVLSAE